MAVLGVAGCGGSSDSANLSGADLRGVDLDEAQMRGATLVDADLSGTNLNLADLSGADLSRTNLSGAKFCKTTMPDGVGQQSGLLRERRGLLFPAMPWKVWYQSHGKFAKRYASGMLMIEPGRATYEGKKESVTINNASKVDRQMIGMNTWIHVEYEAGGETRHAYFLDKRMLGWSGVLGGNDKLHDELIAALT
ncbi:MAG TPA: pentapeptide repeat-containing protein [Gaiellaceae bacterium]